MRRLAALALLLAAPGLGQGARPPAGSLVQLEVDAGRLQGPRLPRTLFGTFLEPIGNSIYGGLWAELLANPSFEDGLWSAAQLARMLEADPELARSSRLGLPVPWKPLDDEQGNRYEPRPEAVNSSRSLAVLGVGAGETGIRQRIYLPVERQREYTGSFYARHLSGPATVAVSLRSLRREGGLRGSVAVAEARVDAAEPDWRKYEFRLSLAEGAVRPLEPVDFVLAVAGEERVLFDQISLMPADHLDGLDPEIVALSRRLRSPLLRFGGNFTSAYHWRDGVGPRDRRTNLPNLAWGMPEYNYFGTDELLQFCRLIGAEPQIALNLGSGTAEEAAGWVRYVNERWPGHGGLTWELGNELWGNWNLGYPTLREVAGRTRAFSEAVRRVDGRARLIATGQDPDAYEPWNAAQLTNPPDTFQLLSTHFVVTTDRIAGPERLPARIAEAAFALPVELGRRLLRMQEQISATPGRSDVHLAFTEWLFSARSGPATDGPRYDNMGGAVIAAGFFNMLLTHAQVTPVADMTGLMEFAGIWKKRGRVFVSPAYHVLDLYANADASQLVEVRGTSPEYEIHAGVSRLPDIAHVPYLDVVALVNERRDRLTLMVVNRSLVEELPAQIAVHGFRPAAAARVHTLRADSIYLGNSEEQPHAVEPSTAVAPVRASVLSWAFAPSSVSVIELERER